MCKVQEMLKRKGNAVYSVTPDTPVHEALKVMAERDIGVVLILENGLPLGIFSERDCVYELSLNKDWALDAPIKKFMISPIYYSTPDQTVEDCMVVMTAKNAAHLDEPTAKALADALRGARFSVTSVEEKQSTRRPPTPFTTSSLQQDAGRKLGFNAKYTLVPQKAVSTAAADPFCLSHAAAASV